MPVSVSPGLGVVAFGNVANICHIAKTRHLAVMSRDVVLAPARNDTVPIQEVSVQTACH